MRDIVEAHLANENFGVEDLVRESGMSHSNLHRKLRSISNQTISQFIREVRLVKAKELLKYDDLTVSEISYKVGFGSPTYFNKCFHEYYGHPPLEFKNQELNKSTKFTYSGLIVKLNRNKRITGLVVSLLFLVILFLILGNKLFS